MKRSRVAANSWRSKSVISISIRMAPTRRSFGAASGCGPGRWPSNSVDSARCSRGISPTSASPATISAYPTSFIGRGGCGANSCRGARGKAMSLGRSSCGWWSDTPCPSLGSSIAISDRERTCTMRNHALVAHVRVCEGRGPRGPRLLGGEIGNDLSGGECGKGQLEWAMQAGVPAGS
jgi:hypothetical protein